MSRRRPFPFIPRRVVSRRWPSAVPSILVVVMVVMVVVMMMVVGGLLLAGLIDGRALGDAVIVALPHDVCVYGESKQAFDRLPVMY